MDLELATIEDIIKELRRRHAPFVLVGVEPNNSELSRIHVGALGKDIQGVLRLLRLGRLTLDKSRFHEDGGSDERL